MNRFALVDWTAVGVAALVGVALCALWYRRRISRRWPLVLAGMLLLNLIAAAGIAMQNGTRTSVWFALHVGLMGAVFFIAPALGIVQLLERRPFRQWLVHAGCQVISFAAMGAVIGAWPR